jgi:adenine-specific DNA-methyltransferase
MADPIAIAEISRRSLTNKAEESRRTALGQFFTPPEVARFIAAMSAISMNNVRLLDAGAGGGALTAAWVAEICSREQHPSRVSLTAYEIDEGLLPQLKRTLAACKHTCEEVGIHCTWEVRAEDFIQAAVQSLDNDLFSTGTMTFDVAVLNPPYKKLRSDSAARSLLHRLGIETSNLYAAFVALAVLLLNKGGELIAITPRSFCNGPYFRPFRQHLLRYTSLTHVHIFETRDQAFREDKVLQENVIFRTVKGVPQQSHVLISQSRAPDDPHVTKNIVSFDRVLKKDDSQSFFHLVSDDNGHAIARTIESLPCKLPELELTVSTGRVVDFRARRWIRMEPSPGTVPLIYPAHFAEGTIRWPKSRIRKPNAIVCNAESESLMVPMGVYALVRRFSSKEEPRRVVAAVFDPARMPFPVVGFENHLNYFHRQGKPLDRLLAKGLVAFLNSTIVDKYFRQFNGHTQVNAEDLRSLRYPSKNALMALGRRVGNVLSDQDSLDSFVAEVIDDDKHSRTPNRRGPTDTLGLRPAQRAKKR